jgi:uncharacterized membrane protein YdfJ with MMPL/SSD domain
MYHTLVSPVQGREWICTQWPVAAFLTSAIVCCPVLVLSLPFTPWLGCCSLFIVSRFMTERRARPRPEDVLVVMDRVMGTSGRTIQFSAVTVMLRYALFSHTDTLRTLEGCVCGWE